jgi:hypothetical protein
MINIAFSSGCVEDGRWEERRDGRRPRPEEMGAQVISCRPAFSDASAAHAIATAYHMCVQFLGYFIRHSPLKWCHFRRSAKKVVENVEKIAEGVRMDGLIISNPYTKCHHHKQKDGQYHY